MHSLSTPRSSLSHVALTIRTLLTDDGASRFVPRPVWDCLVWLAICIAAYKLAVLLAGQHITNDAGIFMAVGRGILNGIPPYTGLFESKPPGVFLVSALAHLFYAPLFLLIVQAAIVLTIPFLADRTKEGFLFGLLLAYFTLHSAQGFQEELCGVFFSLLYLRSRTVLWKGVWLFLAVFFKETFILVLLAAAVLESTSVRDFIRRFVLPCLIGGCLFVLAVVVPRWHYFSVYLPIMLENRVNQNLFLDALKLWRFDAPPALFVLGYGLIRKSWKIPIAVYVTMLSVVSGSAIAGGYAVMAAPLFLAGYRQTLLLLLVPLFLWPRASDTTFAKDQLLAAEIDGIMNNCRLERYMYITTHGHFIPALTTHSPIGPAFFMDSYFLENVYLRNGMIEAPTHVDLIVFKKTTRALYAEYVVYQGIQEYVIENFTTEPPKCGRQWKDEQFVLFYRKSLHSDDPSRAESASSV